MLAQHRLARAQLAVGIRVKKHQPAARALAGAATAITRQAQRNWLRPRERLGAPLMVLASVAVYVLLSTPLGFLLVAPVCLVMLFRTFGQRWGTAVLWAVVGTLMVHVAFYKLLRVPLPWGVLKPFY
jgi:putative tricarboxylic transport membrane protein